MKKFILFLFLLFSISSSANAQLIDEIKVAVKKVLPDKRGSNTVKDYAGHGQSRYNLDISGLVFIFPDQRASEKFLGIISGYGATYKFSELLSIWGRFSQFTIDGAKLDGVNTEWKHEHIAVGLGFRSDINGGKNRIAINIGPILYSKVIETSKFGAINELGRGIALDAKYLFVKGDFNFGPFLSLNEVPSKSTKYATYNKGGYTLIGLTLQFGFPSFGR